MPLLNNPKIVLHLIPLVSFASQNVIDFNILKRNTQYIIGLYGASGNNFRYNFDGFVSFATCVKEYNQQNSIWYTQLFRNGVIEAVDAFIIEAKKDNKVIPVYYEEKLINALNQYLKCQKKLELNLPILVMLSLINVKGYIITNENLRSSNKIDRDHLLIPESVIEDYDAKAADILRPMFDSIWQACGYERSFNYDEKGNWIRNNR